MNWMCHRRYNDSLNVKRHKSNDINNVKGLSNPAQTVAVVHSYKADNVINGEYDNANAFLGKSYKLQSQKTRTVTNSGK